ncbi:MAG: hypothetical protein AAFV80_20115 [Bacteroidota bacterium]
MPEYEKFLYRPNATLPAEHLTILEKGNDLSEKEVLAHAEKNQLLEDGYLKGENGFYHAKDGSVYVAVRTPMPNVSIEMIDWWFWWHPAEALRYQIWYPEMHFDARADFGGHYDNNTKSYRERLHLSTHYVTEDIGTGREELIIDFMSPKAFGFNPNLLRYSTEQTILCTRVGLPAKGVWFTDMCHEVRKTGKGVEMRSRFWIGRDIRRMGGLAQGFLNALLNKPFVKKQLIPKDIGKHMFQHCSQEYHNLALLLPEIYPEEGP